MSQTLITSRDSKGLHAVGLFKAAYDKSELDDVRAQRLNERGGELQDGIAKLITELTMSNQYADEELYSSYTYPEAYKGPELIADQINVIAKIFDLDPASALEFANNLPALPDSAEGWFAIPSVEALAKKHFPKVTDPAEMCCQAVQLVHAKIAASRPFYNYRDGQITPAQFRVHARTAHALASLTETQKGDILIVAAQLGMRHRGKSVRRARKVFAANEFDLGSLAVCSIVLTHPERLARWAELNMNCSGDEFSPNANGDFPGCPCLDFDGGEVRFDANAVVFPCRGFGSVSGFLVQ
ncbi:MAG: hypothetical protein IPK84_02470 [Candidatus Moraniibacteriota bacterium]|nr:MAG: hypothetical protein IPK84_02470 [Candidatus Moranbacteria bacterium]